MEIPTEHSLVFEETEPCRLDQFVARALPDLSRSLVRKLVDEGLVRLGGKEVKASRILRGGEKLTIVVPPPQPSTAVAETIPLEIVYEDDQIIVINKAAGMVVHPAPGHHSGTLVNALLGHCGDLAGAGGPMRPGIVHRLDIGTTGLIIAAKDDRSHRALQKQFKARTVKKTYIAILFGVPRPEEGEIDVAIGRDRLERTKISARSGSPRRAVTKYRVTQKWEDFSLVEVDLITGRTHQIRVHCAHIRHPLVGDTLYGGNHWRGVLNRPLRAAAQKFGRPALHAWRLALTHPLSGEPLEFTAPLPADMNTFLDRLRAGK